MQIKCMFRDAGENIVSLCFTISLPWKYLPGWGQEIQRADVLPAYSLGMLDQQEIQKASMPPAYSWRMPSAGGKEGAVQIHSNARNTLCLELEYHSG